MRKFIEFLLENKAINKTDKDMEKYKMNGLIIKPEWLDRIILYGKDIEVKRLES